MIPLHSVLFVDSLDDHSQYVKCMTALTIIHYVVYV